MLPFDSLAFRADQLVVAIGLAAGYLHVLWLKRHGQVPPKKSWLRLLARVAPIALALLLVAIVANVVGNISLADLLIRGTLTSTYASAVLFAAAFIVDDFVRMMVRSKVGQNLRMITLRGEAIAQGTEKAAHFVALLAWLYVTVSAFQLLYPVSQRIKQMLETSWAFGELSFTLGGIGTFVLGVLIAVYASRTVRFLLNEEVLSRVAWPPGAKSTTATLAYYGVLFAGLLLALNAAGIETSQFAIIFGALGVGIGFGLQNVVNNFVSGLILMFERPIQPGDIIDIDTLQGRVIEIGLRATRVKTWEGAEVVVPNGNLLSGNLINWTLSDSSRRVELPIGVAYGSDVRRVLDILMRVATEQREAMKDPGPNVLFVGFGESSLDFVVRFWTQDATVAVAARSEAGVAIAEALAAEGIQIPFPQRDLHIRSVDAGAAEALK
jgi:small-conductance mechanosensitive channel